MDYKNIKFEKEDNIAVVTISRPKVLNALNDEMIDELHHVFDAIAADKDIRCVILTGEGKAFVAGADIGELAECDVQAGHKKCKIGQALMHKMEALPKAIIAAVNGFALGGGCEIAMACDIRLASEKAKLGQPESTLGIIPGYGGTQRLARLVGYGKAKEWIFSGDIYPVQEAHRAGLVDEIYPPEELMDKAKEMAKKIASRGPLAIAYAKEAINRGINTTLDAGCEHEATLFAAICASKDKNEGTKAFLEKRPADFVGE